MSLPNIPRAVSSDEPLSNTQNMNHLTTTSQKLKFMLTHITMEPLVLFFVLSAVMKNLLVLNLSLEKSCRVNLNFNSTVCDAMVRRDNKFYTFQQESQVQKMVSITVAIRTICTGSFPAILMLFFGSWSDRHGRRKPVVLTPLIGEIISCSLLLICSYYMMELPVEAVVISDALPSCLSGGWFLFFLGVYSYVSGLSSDDQKTVRIGAITMCQNIGITIGVFLSGFLMQPLGFKGVLILIITLLATGVIYLLSVIKEIKLTKTDSLVKIGKKDLISDFWNVENVKGTFRICFKDGVDNRKSKMILIMFIAMMLLGPFCGEYNVLYLYTRLKFGWDEVDYSIYNTFHFLIQLIGSVFALAVFSKYLKLDDAMLGIIATISKMASCIIYAFAPIWQIFYSGAAVEIFYITSFISLRSLMAKIVPSHELGQTNSVFGMCEAVMPLVFGPLYTILYNFTIDLLPGTFFLVSVSLYSVALVFFILVYRTNRRETRLDSEIRKNVEQEENLLKKACFNEIKKNLEKGKSTRSLPNIG